MRSNRRAVCDSHHEIPTLRRMRPLKMACVWLALRYPLFDDQMHSIAKVGLLSDTALHAVGEAGATFTE